MSDTSKPIEEGLFTDLVADPALALMALTRAIARQSSIDADVLREDLADELDRLIQNRSETSNLDTYKEALMKAIDQRNDQ